MLFYKVGVVAEQKGLYEQVDSPHPNLRRDSAELFIKEVIPPLLLTLVSYYVIAGYRSNFGVTYPTIACHHCMFFFFSQNNAKVVSV